MSFLDTLRRWFRPSGPQPVDGGRRTYLAGTVSRLSGDFVPPNLSADDELVRALALMRSRSRSLRKNDPYSRRFIRLAGRNIVGSSGVQFSLAKEVPAPVAERILARWRDWSCSRWCSADGRMTLPQLQRLAVTTAATDGETFLRFVYDSGNPFLLSLYAGWTGDNFDEQYNVAAAPGGGSIRLSVQQDSLGRPLGYWWRPPSVTLYPQPASAPRLLVPAAELVHWFLPEDPGASRGAPWLFSAITQINQLSGYTEAELVAARMEACKGGFFEMPEGTPYTGDGKNAAGQTITEVSPGQYEQLPPGAKFVQVNPTHPNGNFGTFSTAMLRAVAAGGDVAYPSLSGDLSAVNYSSARIGLLDERDAWQSLQDDFVAGWMRPVFRAWLVAQAALGEVPLSVAEAAEFAGAVWRPRRWTWVDPAKEVAAAKEAVALRIKSRTAIVAESGGVFDDVVEELAAEEELLDAKGLKEEPEPGPGRPSAPDEDESRNLNVFSQG
jgi:lambda family phage portal protein